MTEQEKRERQEYISGILSDYGQPKKTFWQPTTTYTPTATFMANTGNNTAVRSSVGIVRKSLIAKLWVTMTGCLCVNGLINLVHPPQWLYAILCFLLIIPLLLLLGKIPWGKPVLIIQADGIWFRQQDISIEWKEVLLTYIKKTGDGDTVHSSLLVHYHHPRYNTYECIETPLNSLMVSVEDICVMIETNKAAVSQ